MNVVERNLKLLFCCVAIFSLGISPQAIASVSDSNTQISIKPENPRLWLLEEPKLPPLQPSDYLPAPEEVIRLVIRLGDRKVYVYRGDEVQTSFPIAVGKDGWETPTGTYTVMDMQENPIWEHPWTGEIVPPGPNNPLGKRWIGFWTDGTNYIGFHGTPNEASVGNAASHGCVRMYNRDILALYSMVELGTSVTVEP